MKIYNLHSPFFKDKKIFHKFKDKKIISIKEESLNKISNKIDYIFNLINNQKLTKIILYGQVQSGKTLFFTSLLFKFIDKFKDTIFLILSDNNKKLLDQTYQRLNDEIKSINQDYKLYKFDDFKNFIHEEKVVKNEPRFYFCLKQKDHLNCFADLIKNTSKINKIVIIDDESDVASVSLEDKAIKKGIEDIINISIQKNAITNYFPITATPFNNCSVKDNNLKPDEIIPLIDNEEYFGLHKFYKLINSEQINNIVCIDASKYDLDKLILDFISDVQNSFEYKTLLINKEYENIHQDELTNEIKEIINKKNNLGEDKIIVAPLNSSEQFKNEQNEFYLDDNNIYKSQIIIGCNKVSRGVTFKHLDYVYLLGPQKISASTLLQRARWFGYRKNIDKLIIYLPENYIDYYIYIADLVALQFYILNNKEKLSADEFNEIFANIEFPKDLEYSKFLDLNISKISKQMWFDDNWYDHDVLKFSEISKLLELMKSHNSKIINNNLVFEFENYNQLLKVIGNDKIDKINKRLSDLIQFTFFKVPKDKKIIIRFIDFDLNTKEFKVNFRKQINKTNFKSSNLNKISVHGYNDEYNNYFFNDIVIDLLAFQSWKYVNSDKKDKIINNNINYKVLIKSFK